MREGPSVGFFTCLEETDRNESSRNCLLLCFARRPSSAEPPCLPTMPVCHPLLFLLLQAGAPGREQGWAGSRVRETRVQTLFLPLTQQATLAKCLSCFHLVSLEKGTATWLFGLW